MKYLLISAILLLTTSCGENFEKDDKLNEFVNIIDKSLSKKDVHLNLDFNLFIIDGLKDEGKWGYSKGNSIYIDKSAYYNNICVHKERIEALILHEIGHNRFGLGHIDSQYYTDSLNRPIIMRIGAWQIVDESNIDLMYDRFVEDLEN